MDQTADGSQQGVTVRTASRHPLMIVVVCLVLVIPVGLGVLAILFFDRSPLMDDVAESVMTFQPETAQQRGESDVVLALTWEQATPLVAPQWMGVVTRVPAKVGDIISGYDKVVEIDGITRLAWQTKRPFYRSLSSDDRGWDVTALQKALNDLGFLDSKPNGLMDWDTVAAVKAYSKKIGYTTGQEVFDPGWVVFLPVKRFTVAEIHLVVGTQAPAVGTSIFGAETPLESVRVTAIEADLPSPADQWQVVVDGQAYQFDDTGYIAVEHLPEIAKSKSLLGNDDSATSDDAGTVHAIIQRVKPLMVQRVPSISVSVAADGRHCVWVVKSDTNQAIPQYDPVFVELLQDRSQSGVTLLVGLPDGLTLVSNPRTSLGFESCP